MGRTEALVAVLDAGPIIHLDELAELDLLADFSRCLVPETVMRESERHRPGWQQRTRVSIERISVDTAALSSLVAAFGLHAGEAEAIALARSLREPRVLLCDDSAARLAAQQLGLRIHGTLGILLRSIRVGRRTKAEVLRLLECLPEKSTLFISPALLAEIREEVERLLNQGGRAATKVLR
jgi:predicted nucleic acid-binding protein